MGKKKMQARQARPQVRQVRPRAQPAPTAQQQKRQRQRFVAAGGMLQGYSPEQVMRWARIAGGVVLVCALIILELLIGPVAPRDLAVRIVAALAWLFPAVILITFVGPAARLAWSDRKKEPALVQGQLLGASTISTSLGLGTIMIKTRAGQEQFLCPPEKLAKVPGNVVNVAITVTPGLRHVRSLALVGQRMVGRPEPVVPDVLKRLRLLPIVTPAALAVAVLLGDEVVAFAPIALSTLHALLAVLAALVLAGLVYGASFLLQRRLMAAIQTLIPGGAG